MSRGYVIAGNWKMNNTPKEAIALVKELIPLVKNATKKVVVCPPFVCIPAVVEAVKGTNIQVGAQNMHFEEKGAYTGEVSAKMLTELGVKYVIIGHSERRQYFAETDETVNKKVIAALENDLFPIVCVGESLEQRESGTTNDVVTKQVKAAFKSVSSDKAKKIIIAYEPIWAIGTGKTATSEQANEVCKLIRNTIKELYDENVSNEIIIQYGGSMNAKNASDLLAQSDIDGGLIGGASLKAQDFAKIVEG